MKVVAGWQRHDLPPWERQRNNQAEYALQLEHPTPGAESWVVVGKGRLLKNRRVVWQAVWFPAGCRGLHPHICTQLFITRTLKAAQLFVELWASTSPPAVKA